MMSIAKVILRDAVRMTDRLYTYLIPDEMKDAIVPGSYVEVPFGKGNRMMTGCVIEVSDEETAGNLKAISSLKYPHPVLTDEQIKLIKPLASRYLCKMGDVLSLMVPSQVGRIRPSYTDIVSLVNKTEALSVLHEGKLRSMAHIRILEYLLDNGDTSRKRLLSSCDASSEQLRAVVSKGLISIKRIEGSDEEDADEKDSVPAEGLNECLTEGHELNPGQDEAFREISAADETKPSVFLLHGITGSGKTEVYLKCAGEVLKKGGSVIYMVPEISLTPQTASRITGRFGDRAAVFHSRLNDRQRLVQWERIRSGKANIIVGPRSVIFAPVNDLKMIVIDEEHDSSYKSETFPRYNAKDVAAMRAKLTGASIVLGSATPSVSSYYAAKQGIYKLLKLTKRANPDAVLPRVIPVDMKEEIRKGTGEILSSPLRTAIAKAVADKKQSILFLNRRGYSRTLICEDCGSPVSCPRCSVGMTLHTARRSRVMRLICHYCGYTIPSDEAVCSECGGSKLTRSGIGTQQLEEMLQKIFPAEKILRMDQDTTMTTGSHEEILRKFRDKEASILIGTQMIAKGHDFPDVTVVGIIGADMISSSSDFRSSERAFQLITQASGRAGRAENRGEVYLQSYRPDDPLLIYAASQNYEAFYDEEIRYREAMNLPPFKAVGEMVLSLPDEDMLTTRSYDLEKYLRDYLSCQPDRYGFELMGPNPSPIYELRGRYRMVFVLKAVNKSALNAVFRQVMTDFTPDLYPISFDTDSGSI